MRKIFVGMFCVALCLAVGFIFPQLGGSWPTVDDEVCFDCHGGENPYPDGEIHSVSAHTDCTTCHDGTPEAGNVNSSACIVCHPQGDVGQCNLVNFHDPDKGAGCLSCHPTCEEETTTTTSTDETSTTTTVEDTSTTTTTDETSTTTTTDETSTTTTAIECCLVEVYGEGSAEVAILRFVRDNVLSQTAEGQEIIRLYYQLSPLICESVQSDEAFREELKEMVDGILQLM